jgi:hypothetical protein
MAVTTARLGDVAAILAGVLEVVPGLRTYAHVPDTFRPPGAVVGLPTIDYADSSAGFCSASHDFPVTLIVSRSNDREAQAELSRLLAEVVSALDVANVAGVTIRPQTATPTTASVGGQDLPAYSLRVLVHA